MLRTTLLTPVALLGVCSHAEAQALVLPQIGIQNSGACRQINVKNPAGSAQVALGCLDTNSNGFAFFGTGDALSVGGTLLPSALNGKAPRVANNAALSAISGNGLTLPIVRDGYSGAGDGGRAVYVYKSSAPTISGGDGFTQIPASSGGTWVLDVSQGQPSLYAAGAKCDGMTDDSAAFTRYQNLFGATSGTMYGGTIRLPPNVVCRIGTSFSLYPHVVLEGHTALTDVAQPQDFAKAPGLAVDRSATINMADNSTVRNLFIKRTGMTFPTTDATAFAGQPITHGGPYGQRVEGVTVVGFDTCIGQSSALKRVNRFVISGFYGDCVTGINISKPSYDVSIIKDVHLAALASIENRTQASDLRSGVGLWIQSNMDGGWIDNVFSHGHATNFQFNNVGALSVGFLWGEQVNAYMGTTGGKIPGINLNVQNSNQVHIARAELWDGYYNAVINNTGNQVSFGSLLTNRSVNTNVVLTAGDLSIAKWESKGAGTYHMDIQNSASRVQAVGMVSGGGTTGMEDICVPSGADSNKIDVKLMSDKGPGVQRFGCNVLSSTTLASAANLALPPTGDNFAITGNIQIASISGGSGAREVTLQFTSAMTLVTGGNILLSATYGANNGSFLKLRWNSATNQWREIGRSP